MKRAVVVVVKFMGIDEIYGFLTLFVGYCISMFLELVATVWTIWTVRSAEVRKVWMPPTNAQNIGENERVNEWR